MTSNICYTLTHILKQFGFPHVCIGDTSLEDIVSPVFFLSSPLALYSIRGTYNNDISIDFHIEKPSFAFFFSLPQQCHGKDVSQQTTYVNPGPPVPTGERGRPSHRRRDRKARGHLPTGEAGKELLGFLAFRVSIYR